MSPQIVTTSSPVHQPLQDHQLSQENVAQGYIQKQGTTAIYQENSSVVPKQAQDDKKVINHAQQISPQDQQHLTSSASILQQKPQLQTDASSQMQQTSMVPQKDTLSSSSIPPSIQQQYHQNIIYSGVTPAAVQPPPSITPLAQTTEGQPLPAAAITTQPPQVCFILPLICFLYLNDAMQVKIKFLT